MSAKKLNEIGVLDDNLVPKIVVEKADLQVLEKELYDDGQLSYFPPELVNQCLNSANTKYHCYLIGLKPHFEYEIEAHDIVLAVRSKFEMDVASLDFELEVGGGSLMVQMKYIGELDLSAEKVLLCRMFQITLFRVLIDHDLKKVEEIINMLNKGDDIVVDYLLLPSTSLHQKNLLIDWNTISSVQFSCNEGLTSHTTCLPSKGSARGVQTKDGLVCSCMLENAVVHTPHTGDLYCLEGFSDELDGGSIMIWRGGRAITYGEHFESRHGVKLRFERESLLCARHIFKVQNHLQRTEKGKEPMKASFKLPPELCSIVMSPMPSRTLYSFSFVPSIMHRIESLLIAENLKMMQLDHGIQNVAIPTIKVLEAITTKNCQEAFHLESLETLGDSFLKYAVSQQLFKTYQHDDQGLLTNKREKIISNEALCKLGCDCKIPGFIRNNIFDPKKWIVPGDQSGSYKLKEELLKSSRKIYVRGKRNITSFTVADAVEALIGAYLSTGGEIAALLFMDWLGIKVEFVHKPYERYFQVNSERLVNISHLKSLLNDYSFRDPSLLVEALTHGSYVRPGIPRSYQRLEFLGDSVLDFAITMDLYHKYPDLSPGLLTELRSASVNNDCYAQCTVRAELYKHILRASHTLDRHIDETVQDFKEMSLESTFGFESDTSFPRVLADIIESLAGAILVDSGYNKEVVFKSIRPLLEPMITLETIKFNPVKELEDLCKKDYHKEEIWSCSNGWGCTIKVEAKGVIYEHTWSSTNKKTAKKVACKKVLKSLKEVIT